MSWCSWETPASAIAVGLSHAVRALKMPTAYLALMSSMKVLTTEGISAVSFALSTHDCEQKYACLIIFPAKLQKIGHESSLYVRWKVDYLAFTASFFLT